MRYKKVLGFLVSRNILLVALAVLTLTLLLNSNRLFAHADTQNPSQNTRVITANLMGWSSEFYSTMAYGFGVRMMSSGNTGVEYTFAIPFDYAGGDLRVREWYFIHDAPGTAKLSCTIQKSPSSGGSISNVTSHTPCDFTGTGGDTVRISSIPAASVTPGDLYSVIIERSGDDPSDTMGRLDLRAVAVEYTGLSYAPTPTPTLTPTPTPAQSTLSINAGGQAAGSFVADTDATGGSSYTSTLGVDTSGVTNPAPQAVYQTARYGNSFTYTIPNLTPNTTYTVKLHFNELYWGTANAGGNGGVGSRVFSVAINGNSVLSNFDIFQQAGGANKALVEPFTATADGNGNITIQFTTVTDNAIVNGIELSQ